LAYFTKITKTSTLYSANFTAGNTLLKERTPNDQQQNKITYSRAA